VAGHPDRAPRGGGGVARRLSAAARDSALQQFLMVEPLIPARRRAHRTLAGKSRASSGIRRGGAAVGTVGQRNINLPPAAGLASALNVLGRGGAIATSGRCCSGAGTRGRIPAGPSRDSWPRAAASTITRGPTDLPGDWVPWTDARQFPPMRRTWRFAIGGVRAPAGAGAAHREAQDSSLYDPAGKSDQACTAASWPSTTSTLDIPKGVLYGVLGPNGAG